MAIHSNVNNANGMPKWVTKAAGVAQGYNANATLTFANGSNQGVVVGLTAAVMGGANTNKYHQSGWTKIQRGTGPVLGFSVVTAGSNVYANGETVGVSNGSVNAVGVIVTNAAGNITSVGVRNGGSFQSPNVALTVLAYNQEKHLVNIVVGGTPTGYSNTDVIVASNGTINASATVSTNATGGFVSGNVTITNPGLWGNTAANNTVVFTVLAANGAASAGSGATFTANIGFTGTGANVVVTQIGGKAGRVNKECLVAMGSMTTANAAADYANLP